MKTITGNEKFGFPETFAIILFLYLLIASHVFAIHSPAMAQSSPAEPSNSIEEKGAKQPEPKKVKPLGPADEFNRGVPRSSLKGYLKAARDGDFERASQYLDLRYLPDSMDKSQGPQLARQLKIALDKVLWFDLDAISAHPSGFSDDDLPANRDIVGRVINIEQGSPGSGLGLLNLISGIVSVEQVLRHRQLDIAAVVVFRLVAGEWRFSFVNSRGCLQIDARPPAAFGDIAIAEYLPVNVNLLFDFRMGADRIDHHIGQFQRH